MGEKGVTRFAIFKLFLSWVSQADSTGADTKANDGAAEPSEWLQYPLH